MTITVPARLREPSTWSSIAALAGTAAAYLASAPGGQTAAQVATDAAQVAAQTQHAAASGAPLWLILLTLVSGGLGVYLRERSVVAPASTPADPPKPAA